MHANAVVTLGARRHQCGDFILVLAADFPQGQGTILSAAPTHDDFFAWHTRPRIERQRKEEVKAGTRRLEHFKISCTDVVVVTQPGKKLLGKSWIKHSVILSGARRRVLFFPRRLTRAQSKDPWPFAETARSGGDSVEAQPSCRLSAERLSAATSRLPQATQVLRLGSAHRNWKSASSAHLAQDDGSLSGGYPLFKYDP